MTVIELSFYFAASVFLFINFFLYIKWAKDEPSKAFEIGENGKVFINELKPEKDSRKDNIKAESISRNNQSKMVEKNNLYIREIKRKKYWHSLNEEKTKNIFKYIFGSLGYIVKYPETFNEKDFDLILDDEIVVRINCKKRQVRALEVEKFWKCWKDTKYKGIYVSIYGFGSNSTYLELGKQILLFKLEDVIKMAEGKKPYLRMPENYGKEVKEVENSVSYDRKPEFKGEQPPSQYESYSILLKLLHKLYRDDSFSKKYNKDNENQIISIEYSQGSKKICSVPRKDLLETNSIALAEGGHERVNRYTIGNYIPSKAMKAAKLGTVYCPENILGDKTDEVSNLSKISGKSRLEKEKSRLAEERNNLSYNEQSGASDYSDYLDDETEGIVNLEKISGLSRIAKARKDSSDTDGLVNTDYSDYLDDEYDGIVNFDEISKIRRKDKESTEDAIP